MAITPISSTNHPSLHHYCYPSKPCPLVFNTLHLPPASMPPSKQGSKPTAVAAALVSATATHEIVALDCDAAAEAARVAVASALEMEENLWDFRDCEKEDEVRNWRSGILMRRKKRRKRRKASLGNLENEKVVNNGFLRPDDFGEYLTRKQEAEYSFCLKEAAKIEAVRHRIEATAKDVVTSSQWAKAAGMSRNTLDKILCNGREAQDRITRCYRRLVISVASAYQGRGLSLQDLIQEGNLGLLHGAKKFSPEKGYKLSTYVYWWIRQAISSAVAKKSTLTRLPGSISELVPKICEATAVLTRRLRKLPTCEQIAELVKKDSLTVALALERNREPISLDQAMSVTGCMSLQEIVTGPDEITPEAMVMKEFMKEELNNLLKRLSDREINILRLYYGLNGQTPLSFEDIGRRLNLSRERVRQISCAALEKLREISLLSGLKVYIA